MSIRLETVTFVRGKNNLYFVLVRRTDILRQRTRDIEVKKYCIRLLEKLGSFSYTREILQSLDLQAREEVAALGENPRMMDLMDELLSWKNNEQIDMY